jgi:hypothetical protein
MDEGLSGDGAAILQAMKVEFLIDKYGPSGASATPVEET